MSWDGTDERQDDPKTGTRVQSIKFAKDSREVLKVHTDMMKLHYRALGCHCEVMGMMSENMLSACEGTQPMFGILHFKEVLHRWGLTDQKGDPII